MKKLVIAAVIVCAAVVSQAASINWTCSNINDASGNPVSGVAYLFATVNWAASDVATLAGTGAENIASEINKASHYAAEWKVTSGKADTFATADRIDISDMNLTAGSTYSFYAVVFDANSIEDASNFYITTIKENLAMGTGTANKVVGIGSQTNTDGTLKGTWYAVDSIPEPTSGLLMLLGMAGLALRRRRA